MIHSLVWGACLNRTTCSSHAIFLLYACDQSNHGSHGRMKYDNLNLNRINEIKTGYNTKILYISI